MGRLICYAMPSRCDIPCARFDSCHPKYRRQRRLSDATKESIMAAVFSGLKPVTVAGMFAVSDAAVYRLIRVHNATGTTATPKRPRKVYSWQLKEMTQ